MEWEDVRLQMLDEQGAPVPGKVYGKVTQVKPAAGQFTATIRFTSVAPEVYQIIRRAVAPGDGGLGAPCRSHRAIPWVAPVIE